MTRYLLSLLAALLFSGCAGVDNAATSFTSGQLYANGIGETSVSGRLYTNITQPLSVDFRNTSVGAKRCVLDEYKLKEPVSGYGVSVEWTTDLIRAAAKEAGITNISYTEIQTVSFLLGIYSRRRLIIYGD